MPLFKVDNGKARKLETSTPGKEKNIQTLFERNLPTILNIDLLGSEYVTTWGGRIDTIGIDKNGSPVIIEYKKSQNDNIINQGLSYLRWLLDRKADFEKVCQQKSIATEIDWDSPRLICVAENYNKFDLDTAELLGIKIELIKFTIYDNDLLYLDSESQRSNTMSTTKISEGAKKSKIESVRTTRTIEDHLSRTTEHAKKLFDAFREKVINLDKNIIEEPKKKYIAYKLATNFADVWVQKDSLKIYLNLPSGKLVDPRGLARDLTKPKPVGHWGNGDYQASFEKMEDLDYVLNLVKQSYEFNK